MFEFHAKIIVYRVFLDFRVFRPLAGRGTLKDTPHHVGHQLIVSDAVQL